MQIADRCAPVKVANSAENFVLQALQFHQMSAARLVSSLYNGGADPHKIPPPTLLLLLSWRLPSDRLEIVSARTCYRPLLRNRYLFIRLLHSNGCTRPFRGLCPAAGLYVTLWTLTTTPAIAKVGIDIWHALCSRVTYDLIDSAHVTSLNYKVASDY
jgi:hypothetical protein